MRGAAQEITACVFNLVPQEITACVFNLVPQEITACVFNLIPQEITACAFNLVPRQILSRIQLEWFKLDAGVPGTYLKINPPLRTSAKNVASLDSETASSLLPGKTKYSSPVPFSGGSLQTSRTCSGGTCSSAILTIANHNVTCRSQIRTRQSSIVPN
jgi:hypothetical protein